MTTPWVKNDEEWVKSVKILKKALINYSK